MNTQAAAGDNAATESATGADKDLGAKLERIAPAAKSALQPEVPVKTAKALKRAVKKTAKQLAKPAVKKAATQPAKPAAEPASKKTVAKPATKKPAKTVAKAVAKAAPKTAATKAPKKPAAKAATQAVSAQKPAARKPAAGKPVAKKAAAKPVAPTSALAKALASAEQAIEKRVKIVRDSFTMPKPDFELIDRLKARAIKLGRPAKKSELLRAGLHALNNLREDMLKTALQALPVLKTGRPKKR